MVSVLKQGCLQNHPPRSPGFSRTARHPRATGGSGPRRQEAHGGPYICLQINGVLHVPPSSLHNPVSQKPPATFFSSLCLQPEVRNSVLEKCPQTACVVLSPRSVIGPALNLILWDTWVGHLQQPLTGACLNPFLPQGPVAYNSIRCSLLAVFIPASHPIIVQKGAWVSEIQEERKA